MARTIVIGDVHGCIEELDDLLREVVPRAEDRVVFVGDLVGKGPAPQGVVARARELGAAGVRGNHDEKCLEWRRATGAGEDPPPLGRAHAAACRDLGEEEWAWLEALPYCLRLPDVNAVVVHGGLEPGVALDAQNPAHMLRMRSIRADGTISTKVGDGEPWASLWPGPEEVVFGHDAVRGLQRWPHATGIDTGCVYGGRLTAYLLPERQLVSVAAHRAWAPAGGRPS